jgi:hypothetical protein
MRSRLTDAPAEAVLSVKTDAQERKKHLKHFFGPRTKVAILGPFNVEVLPALVFMRDFSRSMRIFGCPVKPSAFFKRSSAAVFCRFVRRSISSGPALA